MYLLNDQGYHKLPYQVKSTYCFQDIFLFAVLKVAF